MYNRGITGRGPGCDTANLIVVAVRPHDLVFSRCYGRRGVERHERQRRSCRSGRPRRHGRRGASEPEGIDSTGK